MNATGAACMSAFAPVCTFLGGAQSSRERNGPLDANFGSNQAI